MADMIREKLLSEYISQNYSDCDETDELREKVSDSFGFNAYCLDIALRIFVEDLGRALNDILDSLRL